MTKKILKLIGCDFTEFLAFQVKCTVFGILYTIAALIFPNAISKVIDQVILKEKYSLTGLYLAIIILSGILMILFNYIQYMSYYKFGQKAGLIIRQKLFGKLMNSGGRFRKKYSSGNILRIIEQDSLQIENLIGEGVGQLVVNSFVVIGVIILLLSRQILIGGIMISVSVGFAMLQSKISKCIKQEAAELRTNLGDTSSFTNELINRSEQIITSGYVKSFVNEFNRRNESIMLKDIQQTKKVLISRNIGIAYNVISNVVTLGIGIYEVKYGQITVGNLLALTMYVQRLYNPLLLISNAYLNIKKAVPFVEKIIDFIEDKDFIIDGVIENKKNLMGKICFERVFFGYDKEGYILEDYNLVIQPGQITALIGDNGSGKSTLVKLLLKIYQCNAGNIYIDDTDINDYSNEYLYSNISIMFQNNLLMSGKLEDIINPGKKELAEGYVESLFRMVELDIRKFKDGLNTYVFENNINVSGGELQKINIIRILIENRPIVILDEPTSALDNESEKEICELLLRLLKGKTVIIITHRKKILDICDQIIKFK